MNTFVKTVEAYRQGARTMPGRYYTSVDVLHEEEEKIWRRHWISVGRSAELASPGDYRTVEIGGESLIVLRDQQGQLRAFFNICRHRGTRLCTGERGRLSETLQCPYHAWTYALDGRLIGAPHMQEVEGFQKTDYPLHQAALVEWNGFLFANLDRAPQPFAELFAPLGDRFGRFNLPALVTVRRIVYDVRANWKLIMQNYSECLHCPTIHPELSTKLPYTSGANDLVDGPFLGGYMDIKAPNQSATMSGRACGLPLGDLSADDRSRGYYYTLFPGMMLSLHPDYAVYYTVWPRSPRESLVVCEWLVHPDSPRSPGYNIGDAEEFWDRTNRQDWDICERSQLGVASSRYEPGPYSPRESMPAAWDREYLRQMQG
ncbi:MAG TPA: aromatic ring-hydroxylating dioxygenase subunit alpha [Gemmatimonadales bacterium]|nr:aromatic ring-hydroxylating dioxygenase subunit alpha [Gemmatimonadales bacterium]